MIKLYKIQSGKIVSYHEAWIDESTVFEHWGNIGESGETRQHPRNVDLDEEDNLTDILSISISKGFAPIEADNHDVLIIEYKVDGFGTAHDLEKRHSLEDRMSETLGWTGLGICDGGSVGSGSMEVCCYVVDFDSAKRVIEDDLQNTEFSDYSRIYTEGII